jgi:hypothetical protein
MPYDIVVTSTFLFFLGQSKEVPAAKIQLGVEHTIQINENDYFVYNK